MSVSLSSAAADEGNDATDNVSRSFSIAVSKATASSSALLYSVLAAAVRADCGAMDRSLHCSTVSMSVASTRMGRGVDSAPLSLNDVIFKNSVMFQVLRQPYTR